MEARDRLKELGASADARWPPAVSARARCRQTIWDTTVLVGTLMSGTAVLLDLLIDEPIQLRLISALIFATVPAAAALVVGAMLVTLLWLLGISYDVIRTLVAPGLLYCVCSGTPLLLDGACRLKEYTALAFGRTADGLMQLTRDVEIRISHILRGAGTRTRSGLEWVSREIALEALWIKQGARRVLDMTKFDRGLAHPQFGAADVETERARGSGIGCLRFDASAGLPLTRRTGRQSATACDRP